MRAGSRTLTLNVHDQLRERRESQVTVARALQEAERMRQTAERIRQMTELYRERLEGNREKQS